MRYAWLMRSMLAVTLGACAAEPADDGATSDASAPAGFETWLAEQCPDGASIQVSEPGRVVACERVRERAVADPAVRDRLVEVYMGWADEVGEAREPLTPLGGLLCGLIASAPGALFTIPPTSHVACGSPQLTSEEQDRCTAVMGGGSLALTILCGVAGFFL